LVKYSTTVYNVKFLKTLSIHDNQIYIPSLYCHLKAQRHISYDKVKNEGQLNFSNLYPYPLDVSCSDVWSCYALQYKRTWTFHSKSMQCSLRSSSTDKIIRQILMVIWPLLNGMILRIKITKITRIQKSLIVHASRHMQWMLQYNTLIISTNYKRIYISKKKNTCIYFAQVKKV